jgi:predicted RNA-binding protein YlxR (DUF448 family)
MIASVKQKKKPQRMCISCRSMKNKMDLARLVKTQDGLVAVDATGKKPGRGAYICKDSACAELAKRQRKIERCFEVRDASAAYAELAAAIASAAAGNSDAGASTGAAAGATAGGTIGATARTPADAAAGPPQGEEHGAAPPPA